MIEYRWEPRMGHVFTCDVCKREIQDDEQVRLLRAMAALPEEPTYAPQPSSSASTRRAGSHLPPAVPRAGLAASPAGPAVT
jgi:hypothetical protein